MRVRKKHMTMNSVKIGILAIGMSLVMGMAHAETSNASSVAVIETAFTQAAEAFELRQEKALVLLQEHISTYPYTPYATEVHLMQGVLLTEKGRYQAARRELNKVVFKDLFRQHEDMCIFYKGYCHLQLDEPAEAADMFHRLRQKEESPYYMQSRYYYAYSQYVQGHYEEALPDFLFAEQTSAYRRIAPYYIIQIHYAQKKYDEVMSRSKALLEEDPANPHSSELYRLMGEIYYKRGQYASAIQQLRQYEEKTLEEKKQMVREDLYLLGMSYYQTQQYSSAITYLKRVPQQRKDSLSQSAQYHMGNAYLQTKNDKNAIQQAQQCYAAAMRMNYLPKITEEAMYNYTLTTYESSTALGESINAFSDFVSAYPNSKHSNEIYTLMSDALIQSKNYNAALDALEKINPPTQRLLEAKQYLRYQIGLDYFLQNRLQDANNYFEQVISNATAPLLRVSQENRTYLTEALYLRAESHFRLGNYDKAEESIGRFMLQDNASVSQNYVQAKYLEGYVYFQKKAYPAAQQSFLAAADELRTQPALYADALNRIGDCYFSQRQFAQAESYYAKAAQQGQTGADYATFQRGYVLGLQKRYGEKVNVLNQLVKTYPTSSYADQAIYEIARAELQRENNDKAIEAYDRLLKIYPQSPLTRKASLEKAMLYYNKHQYSDAITFYKAVVRQYPGTDECRAALEGLEMCYVETNQVNEYVAFVQTLDHVQTSAIKADSLAYAAAELQYMQGNKDAALQQFATLTTRENSPYLENALLHAAELAYDQPDYVAALGYFQGLQQHATSAKNTHIARLGILRCAQPLQQFAVIKEVATQLIEEPTSDEQTRAEALFARGKTLYSGGEYAQAEKDFRLLTQEVRTATEAEAKYLIAEGMYRRNMLEEAENEIMSFASMKTSQQYWLAKAFILLSDIYVSRGDSYQAEQYLLTLQANYRAADDIQTTINEKLAILQAQL